MRPHWMMSVLGLGLAVGCVSDEHARREAEENEKKEQRYVIVQRRTTRSTDTDRQQKEAEARARAQLQEEREARIRAEAALEVERAERAAREAEEARRELETAEAAQAQLAQELESERERARARGLALEEEQRARAAAEADARRALEQVATVREEARGLVVTLAAPVLFGLNDATLLPSAKRRLDAISDALRAMESTELVVEGHTDAAGSDAYNLDLSRRRAEAVREHLLARGVDPRQVRAVGVGEARPVASNASPDGRAENRRVEIVLPDFGVGGAGE